MPERFWKENNTGLVRSEAELLRWWEAGAAGWQTFPIWLKWHFTACDEEGKSVKPKPEPERKLWIEDGCIRLKDPVSKIAWYVANPDGAIRTLFLEGFASTTNEANIQAAGLTIPVDHAQLNHLGFFYEDGGWVEKPNPAPDDEKLAEELFDVLDNAYAESAGVTTTVYTPSYRFNVQAGIRAILAHLREKGLLKTYSEQEDRDRLLFRQGFEAGEADLKAKGWRSPEESEHLRNNLDNALLELEEKPLGSSIVAFVSDDEDDIEVRIQGRFRLGVYSDKERKVRVTISRPDGTIEILDFKLGKFFTDADLKAVKRETAIKSWYLMSSNADYHLREVFLKAIGLEE